MSNSNLKLILHDYNNVNELSDGELEELISEIVDIEEVPSAISELYRRMPDIAINLAKNLISNQRGDEYLQGAVLEFIFDRNNNFIVEFVEDNIDKMGFYVYGCILECLSVESKQLFGENLSQQFLKTLISQYDTYTIDEKNKIAEKYSSFVDAYSL